MYQKLQNLKISTKIYASLAINLLLLFVIVAVGFSGLKVIRHKFDKYNTLAHGTDLASDLLYKTTEVQGNILTWISSEDPTILKDIREDYQIIDQELAETETIFTGAKEQKQLRMIKEDIRAMKSGIAAVEDNIKQTDGLVEGQMLQQGSYIRELTSQIAHSAYQDGDYRVAGFAGFAGEDFIMGRLKASKYLFAKAPEDKREFYEYMDAYKEKLASLDDMISSSDRRDMLDSILSSHSAYVDSVSKAFSSLENRAKLIDEEVQHNVESISAAIHVLQADAKEKVAC